MVVSTGSVLLTESDAFWANRANKQNNQELVDTESDAFWANRANKQNNQELQQVICNCGWTVSVPKVLPIGCLFWSCCRCCRVVAST